MLVAFTAPLRQAAAQHPLVYIPLDDPAYLTLDGLLHTGCSAARISAYRPYLVRDMRQALRRLESDSACAPRLVANLHRFAADTFDIFTDNEGTLDAGAALTVRATSLSNAEFQPYWVGVRPKDQGDVPVAAEARGRVAWGAENVVAVAEAVGYTSRRNNYRSHQSALRHTSGALDFDEAYINAQLGKRITLSFGRSDEAWLGTGRESLVLSAWGPSLDRLALSGRWSRVEARALYGVLSQVELTPQLDTVFNPTRYYRFIVGHALTIRPTNAIEISAGETAILARHTMMVDLAYANPLMVYIVTQNDSSRMGSGKDDNLQLFGATRLHSGTSALDAELLIDDIQIDPRDRKRTQDALGWRVRGTQGIPLWVPASAFVEYRHINSYTYLRNSYATVYENYDAPLASELGPDADMWQLQGELWPAGTIRLDGGLAGWRQGAQRLTERPSSDAEGHAGEPYPTVTIGRPFAQQALLMGAGLSYVTQSLTLTTRLDGARVKNPANQAANAASYLRLQLVGRYAYRIP